MKKNQNEKRTHFRQWKSGKKWVYSSMTLAVLLCGGVSLAELGAFDLTTSHVSADVVNATQVGTLNGNQLLKRSLLTWGQVAFKLQ